MKKLRVLVIRNAYQQDAGGAEQFALNLSVTLNNLGHKAFLVTKVKEILAKAEVMSIKTIKGFWYEKQGWYRGYYLRRPLTELWYIYLILRHRIDVVHPQSRDDFVFATHAAKILGKRVVWTDHADLKNVLDNNRHYNPRMRAWVIKAAKKAHAIMCVSRSEKESIAAVAPDLPKVTVVHNGVLKLSPKPIKKAAGLVIGTNARLVKDKGIAELIESFKQLNIKGAQLWLLGGESGNRNVFEGQIDQLRLTGKVKILGYVDRPEDYMASMDIFVHASYHEGLSLAVIEAAMLGLPIVATAVGGTPEILDKNSGLLVEPKDAKAITTAVKKLVNNPTLAKELGKSAKRRAEAEFGFETIVSQKILNIYSGEKP